MREQGRERGSEGTAARQRGSTEEVEEERESKMKRCQVDQVEREGVGSALGLFGHVGGLSLSVPFGGVHCSSVVTSSGSTCTPQTVALAARGANDRSLG